MQVRKVDPEDTPTLPLFPRSKARIALMLLATMLLVSSVFVAGSSLTRWKGRRVDTLARAYSLAPDGTFAERTKALVAMQREARTVIEIIRMMAEDEDPEIAESARGALKSIADSLR